MKFSFRENRRCLRRQSARFISEQAKLGKDFSELKYPPDSVPPCVNELMEEEGDALSDITVSKGKEKKNFVSVKLQFQEDDQLEVMYVDRETSRVMKGVQHGACGFVSSNKRASSSHS
ncbi:hypothetical protein GIB67_008350 [Kingdonia uniflora]|uniref:Uncharacterized protein n=1 Tax=Kingdonia uniflora TaxID=39325 RepID=A0A7J7N4V2_9MAGN|nr:hypothetical protein GIB67_008350 [Kingdonia uniflora]